MKLFTKYFLKVAVCFYVKRKENNIVELFHVAELSGYDPEPQESGMRDKYCPYML